METGRVAFVSKALIGIGGVLGALLLFSSASGQTPAHQQYYAPTSFIPLAIPPPGQLAEEAGIVASTISPAPSPRLLRAPTPAPGPRAAAQPDPSVPSGASIDGKASWYCKAGVSVCHHSYPPGSMVAAACGRLRAAMGDWRGHFVTVTSGSVSVVVQLVDWCGSDDKLIDLYAAPFSLLAPTSTGVVMVEVSW